MPSSIRSVASRTPRLAELRTNSNNSIHIDHEVTVVTSAADELRTDDIYSSMLDGRVRAQSSQGPKTAVGSGPGLDRWSSLSKMTEGSRYSHQRAHSSTDMASNRESMRALAEFLMRSEPPPSSYTSRPDSDSGSLHSLRRSAFKVFGRSKSKSVSKSSKLLRLPDSAVSATTTTGARHIAISIPLEFDYSHFDTPLTPPSSRPHSRSKTNGERGVVTVLKPVAELRESASYHRTSQLAEKDKAQRLSLAESVDTQAADVLGPETTRTLENYYTQLQRQQRSRSRSSNPEGKHAAKLEPVPVVKNNAAVFTPNIARQDSLRSDPRHSGGTVHSRDSLGSHSALTRDRSSPATTQSGTPTSFKPELPARKSSVTKVSPAIQAELAKSWASIRLPGNDDIARSSIMSDQSQVSVAESNSSRTPIATAEMARSYNAAAGIHTISRSTTPKALDMLKSTSPAPTRQLPDVPESPCIPGFLSSASVSPNRTEFPYSDETAIVPENAMVARGSVEESRQSRHDRVKARKERDMAILRDKSASRKIRTTEKVLPNPQILVTTPTTQRTHPPEGFKKRNTNTISDVMTVVDLAPYTGLVNVSDLPFMPSPERATRRKAKDSDSNGTLNTRGTHTPPSSSAESGNDSTTPRRLRAQESKSSLLDTRRQERRSKRNLSLRDRDTDARLERLEHDHSVLMSTLSGIASSFGELSRTLPQIRSPPAESTLVADNKEKGDSGEEGIQTSEKA